MDPNSPRRGPPDWLERVKVKTLCINPGSVWEKGDIESFNGKLRDELLNPKIFDTLREAGVLIEHGRVEHNTTRPHRSPGYHSPVTEVSHPLPRYSIDCQSQGNPQEGSSLNQSYHDRGRSSLLIAKRHGINLKTVGYGTFWAIVIFFTAAIVAFRIQ